ncbi:MAG: hypothetical protein P4L84_11035 [Isosphaeraceae bacterium]|nr:hypothetical protein [Isosphaeraceae bacterium]
MASTFVGELVRRAKEEAHKRAAEAVKDAETAVPAVEKVVDAAVVAEAPILAPVVEPVVHASATEAEHVAESAAAKS